MRHNASRLPGLAWLLAAGMGVSTCVAGVAFAEPVALGWNHDGKGSTRNGVEVSPLGGFNIYQSDAEDGAYAKTDTALPDAREITIEMRHVPTSWVRMTAVAADGLESVDKSAAVSKTVVVVPPPPALSSPALSLVTTTETSVTIAWDPQPDGLGGIAKVDIRIGTPTEHWGLMISTPCVTSPCTITGLAPTTLYHVQGVGYRGDLNTGTAVFAALGAVLAVTTEAPVVPPAAPTLKILSQTDRQIVVSALAEDCPGGVRTTTTGSTKTVFKRTVTCKE